MAVRIDGQDAGGGGGLTTLPAREEFTPTPGQTVFVLSFTPVVATLEFEVGGVTYDDNTHYTLSGKTITWLNPFLLAPSDIVVVRYRY